MVNAVHLKLVVEKGEEKCKIRNQCYFEDAIGSKLKDVE